MANNVSVTEGSGTTFKTTDNAGVHTGHVNVDSSALPTGAATSSNQDTANTSLAAIETAVEGTLTVSGTVTANLSATDNAVLDSIDTDLTTIAGAVSGTEMQVDIVSGTVTANLSATDNAVLDSIQTAVEAIQTATELLDNAVSGSTLAVSGTVTADAGAGSISAGTAGSPASDVLSVQGISSMTALVVDGSAVTQPVSGTAIDTQAYETVAASQTDQALGATGATGDYLAHVLIVPATTSPGAVSIKDGAGSAITIFTGGTDSVSNLIPFAVPVNAVSGAGAWQVTTGANVSAIGVGTFT